jgi:Bromodomain
LHHHPRAASIYYENRPGLTDYPIIVKKPMDLGTIKKKIKKKEYSTIQEAADDVQLVWKNCSKSPKI